MEPRAHHLLIGLFTAIAAIAVLVFALWLGKSTADRDWAYYDIAFDWAVSGLGKGNPVLYTGVEIGNVVELRLAPNDPSQVRVLVRVDENIPIRQNTRANLVLANITGSTSIQFSGGTPDSPILEGKRSDPPVIKAIPSLFDNLMNNGEVLINKADALLSSAAELMSVENADNLAAILQNTRDASEVLLSSKGQIETLLKRMDDAAAQAGEAAVRVSSVSDNANMLLLNQGRDAFNSMQQALADINSVTSRIDSLTAANQGALNDGLQGMGELAPALRELRHTLRSFNRFARRLEEDPAGTIWGTENIKELSQ